MNLYLAHTHTHTHTHTFPPPPPSQPENVLLSGSRSELKLTDFRLSRSVTSTNQFEAVPKEPDFMGMQWWRSHVCGCGEGGAMCGGVEREEPHACVCGEGGATCVSVEREEPHGAWRRGRSHMCGW